MPQLQLPQANNDLDQLVYQLEEEEPRIYYWCKDDVGDQCSQFSADRTQDVLFYAFSRGAWSEEHGLHHIKRKVSDLSRWISGIFHICLPTVNCCVSVARLNMSRSNIFTFFSNVSSRSGFSDVDAADIISSASFIASANARLTPSPANGVYHSQPRSVESRTHFLLTITCAASPINVTPCLCSHLWPTGSM